MLNNRTLPVVALALAVSATVWTRADAPPPTAKPAAPSPDRPAAPPPPTEAEKTLDEAIKKLEALKSVTASIEQNVKMLGQEFGVEGEYKRGPRNQVFLRLDVKGLKDGSGTTQQVCDGQTLWNYQRILESQNFRKIGKIPQIMEKLDSPELDDKIRDLIVSQHLMLTGPGALLSGLRDVIKFETREEETIDGKPTWVLHGVWKNRDGLLGPDQRPLPPTAALPAYIPSVVSVWIGKEDGWPYKTLLVGKPTTSVLDTRPVGPDGHKIGSIQSVQKVEPSSVALLYTNVKFNPTLDKLDFVFTAPEGARVQDETEMILDGLEKAIQAKLASKKAAAAEKGEDAVLDKAITAPKLPDPPK